MTKLYELIQKYRKLTASPQLKWEASMSPTVWRAHWDLQWGTLNLVETTEMSLPREGEAPITYPQMYPEVSISIPYEAVRNLYEWLGETLCQPEFTSGNVPTADRPQKSNVKQKNTKNLRKNRV